MMTVQEWTEKLNKVDGNIYTVEEAVPVVGGVYEGLLRHDNINVATFAVYTGPKLTGDRLETYALSTPSLTPWKRSVRVYAEAETVYLSYETDGDTVEAEDINRVQDAIAATQEAVNAEEARAGEAEKILTDNLREEAARAQNAENLLADGLEAEITRAKSEEGANARSISAETARASAAEKKLAMDLAEEEARAAAAETSLPAGIEAHTEAVNRQVQSLQQADAALEEKKANASDVSRELGNRYTKDQVYTKAEVLEKIEDLIGSAPDTLDTFREIADALGNDPDFAATIMTALGGKVDKEDGKRLSSNDYTDAEKETLADVQSKKHTHGNRTVLDRLTDLMLSNWTEAYSKRHEHSNKSVLDKVTQVLLDNWGAAYAHISDTVAHITAAERTKWNAVTNKVDKVSGKQLSTNDYTAADKNKLAGIAPGAEVNVQPDWGVTDKGSDAFIRNKPSSFPPSSHSHTKSQITDMPTMLSQFTNDPGYITQSDVDTSQNHTHANKTVLDKITQALVDRWDSALTALPVHTHTKSQITDFPASLPANGGTANYANYLNANSLAANTDLNAITVPGYYYCPANATAAAFKNCPTANAFFMEVGKHAGVYQRVVEYTVSNPRTFERNYYSGTWGTWKNITVLTPIPAGAKFTDTVYSHPNSGVAEGTYRSVTVNAHGHVTGGSNPTTLKEYGITDAAEKKHNHDGAYLKKGGLTWGDLKGV